MAALILLAKVKWMQLGEEYEWLCVKYNSRDKSLHPGPLLKEAIGQRVKVWAERYGGIAKRDLHKFSSHSMRRGGATMYRAAGLKDCDLQSLGRWASTCFTLYTETSLSHLAM